MARKFRISAHGSCFGTWYKIERRTLFFFWVTMTSYISSYDEARRIVSDMKESEA